MSKCYYLSLNKYHYADHYCLITMLRITTIRIISERGTEDRYGVAMGLLGVLC